MTEQRSLSIQGKAGSPIWIMADGPTEARIGIRLDCGDGGTVFVSEDQALDLADQLHVTVVELRTQSNTPMPYKG